MTQIHIIGAGLAGLSAAIVFAQNGIECNLFSLQASERSQSVLAEGGINAALDTMGENDSVYEHYMDTMRGGCDLADPNAVRGLTSSAPDIVRDLAALGVPFNRIDGSLQQRYFGGQKKRRTAFARSSTGKMLVSALIDEVRKYESQGLIHRFPNHAFYSLIIRDGKCAGVNILDIYTGSISRYMGVVLLASGGMNGIFPEWTTGTTQNNGYVAATVFMQGVKMANLEMIQYHPTTIGIPGKRCLVSEAARGEGGRLYVKRNGKPYYFMEDKYELGNLMPRDVVSREMTFVVRDSECENQVFLDMTGIEETVWREKLSDLRDEIIYYMNMDPVKEAIPVEPGIHFFMGGIYINERHETSMKGLYAAGECASQYHGANRLGGNSLLGAIYGGRRSAAEIISSGMNTQEEIKDDEDYLPQDIGPGDYIKSSEADIRLCDILRASLGIVRSEAEIKDGLSRLEEMKGTVAEPRYQLARAMLLSAENRKESRGAHYRIDYPDTDDIYRKTTVATYSNGAIDIEMCDIPEMREE